MTVALLYITVLSGLLMLVCFRVGEAYPWILETKAKFWLMTAMITSAVVSSISLLAFLTISIMKLI